MRTAHRLLFAALATAMSVSVVRGDTVVDDFETGTCHVVGISGSYFEDVVAVASPAHAMAGSRTIGLQSFVVGVAVCSSVCVGVLAGFFPAWKASRFNPIQALRYE